LWRGVGGEVINGYLGMAGQARHDMVYKLLIYSKVGIIQKTLFPPYQQQNISLLLRLFC
jgi:hypothetical protein